MANTLSTAPAYGKILRDAFGVIWRKKYLWFLAFFAGLVSYGGEANILFRNTNSISTLQSYLENWRQQVVTGQVQAVLHQAKITFIHNPISTSIAILVILALVAVFIWLIIVAQSAVIRIVGRDAAKQPATFIDGVGTGVEKFRSLFTLNIFAKLLTWGVWAILGGIPAIVFFLNGQRSWALTSSIGAFIASVPISLVVAFLVKYANGYITLEDRPTMEAIRMGWKLFRQNIWISLEMAVTVYVVNLIMTVVISATLLFLVSPFSWLSLGIILLALAIELAFVTAFSYAAWTILFLRLLEGNAASAVGQWTTRLVNFRLAKRA